MLQQLKAPKLPFRELDMLVKAIGECRSKAEEDRIIAAEVDTLKQRLSDPKLDKTRGREYMVRVIYCEMLGHDASFAYIPALQLASDPNLLTKKVGFVAVVSGCLLAVGWTENETARASCFVAHVNVGAMTNVLLCSNRLSKQRRRVQSVAPVS
eukprot:GHUV01038690.1.p1 GENE.GHUV01038690.1~~GHUV01038690.1.p1  ORF type:complete len:154 (-),score=16.16 GHUV01038690.1:169-630(-)